MALRFVNLGRSKAPLLNEYSYSPMFESTVKSFTEALYKRIKETSELLALLDTVVSDHFLGPVDFFGKDGKVLGPTRAKQVVRLWEDGRVQSEAFRGMGHDFFIDGSCFGWHASPDNVMSYGQKRAISSLRGAKDTLGIGAFADEQASMPRKVSYLAASTVSIKNDKTGVLFYVQDVGHERVRWDVDQVVHIKQEFNGEMRGYSPLKALTREIVMMAMLKDNIIAKLQNGGSPDSIISVVGANGLSRARFERLRMALESFSHLRKSHGNMPVDAEIKVWPMGTSLKDMEYRELAMFTISEFALALGVPTSRVPFLMTGSGGAANKGELSGNSEDSYQMKVNARRKMWEDGWNAVFRKAGFTFRYRRTNVQDDVRETQALSQNAAYVMTVQDSLMKSGMKLTMDAHLAMLSGKKKDITSGDVEELTSFSSPHNPSSPPAARGGVLEPSSMMMRPRVVQDNSETKRAQANNHGVSA